MTRDPASMLRALRRAVYIDKTLTVEDAWRYLDTQGFPRETLDAPNGVAR
ncbi:MAG: hypothetical protein ACYDCK_02580 [Thermoplasmatota archaeon]